MRGMAAFPINKAGLRKMFLQRGRLNPIQTGQPVFNGEIWARRVRCLSPIACRDQVLVMFTWNPLFHVIDQARGFAFINYQPRNSDLFYPLYFSLGLLMLGFIGEYYTRQRASSSWLAKI